MNQSSWFKKRERSPPCLTSLKVNDMRRLCLICGILKRPHQFRAVSGILRTGCKSCEAKAARTRYTSSTGPRAGMGGRKRKYK